jgi:hypothetical protein
MIIYKNYMGLKHAFGLRPVALVFVCVPEVQNSNIRAYINRGIPTTLLSWKLEKY